MKVALVHDFLTQWGGGERVMKVFSEIFPEAPIYLLAYDEKIKQEFMQSAKIIPSFVQRLPGMPKKFKYYLPLMPKAIESFDLSEYDLILSDASAFAKGVITTKNQKHICYLHTPTRYLTSDRHTYIKSAPVPLIARPFMPLVLNYIKKWDYSVSKRPDVIIANSEFIAARTEKYYHRKPDYVLFPPVTSERFRISEEIGDYYLVVARHEPYKRTDLAIQAANRLGFKLKVVGGGTKSKALQDIAGPTVEFVGRVSDTELSNLYSKCIAFIFPPLEDAGITPLEAAASGRPVIAFGQGGALESVVPGVTGEFFNEQTVDSLCEVLKNFDHEKYNPQKIRAHAMRFDQEVFKQKILEIIKQTLK